jgi:sarcosine oxidase subunit beta
MAQLPATAEVVVIGGGVIGASALYHLAAAGCTDTVLIERDTIAAGSTSKAAGGIRAQFSDELNIRMALENIRRFETFADDFGVDIDYKQWGYLFLLLEGHLPAFKAALELQNRLGVPSRLIAPEEAAAMVPQLDLTDVAAATFCPIDGYATPESVAHGYAAAARKLGAIIVQGCDVSSIDVSADKVIGVTTTAGAVATSTVICSAGVWSPALLAPLGLDLRLTPEKRYVWLTEGEDPLPHELPLTIDFDSGFYFQREGRRLLFGGRVPTLEELAPDAVRRLPLLETLPIKPGWWGYYAMSPDHNAIVGAATSPAGVLYATGFSGHGFQQAPVIGDYLAHLALDETPPFDLSPLSLERFAGNDIRPEAHVV